MGPAVCDFKTVCRCIPFAAFALQAKGYSPARAGWNSSFAIDRDPVDLAGRIGVDEYRIERCRCGNEQPVHLRPAKAQIGDGFGDPDPADQPAIRVKAVNPVAGRCPDMTATVDAQAVKQAIAAFGEYRATCQCGAVLRDVVAADMRRAVRIVRTARIGDIEDGFVGEKASPFGFT